MIKKGQGRAKSPPFVIESRGGVLYEEFTDVEPAEFKVKSRREGRLEQENAWEDFDRELREKLRRKELGVDPEKEVKMNDST